MRVAQATMRYHPGLGGVETYVQELSRRLVRWGHQVTVHTSDLERIDQGYTYRRFRGVPSQGEVDGVRIRRHRALAGKGYPYFFLPGLAWGLVRQRADIFHAHNYGYFPADCAALVAALRRKPLAFNAHLMSRVVSPLSRLHRAVLGRLLMSAEAVIVVSDPEKRLILEQGFRVRRFEKVPNGVDPGEFAGRRPDIYRSYGLDSADVVLFVGRLSAYKGVDTLIRAAPRILARLPRAVFFVAGPDFGIKEGLLRMAAREGVASSFVFSGALPRGDLVAAYQHARVFAFPSRAEAFGIVLAEAMAAGLPVVAADAMGITETVKDGETGLLFPPGDAASLAEKVIALLEDGALRERLACRARERVQESYTWDRSARRLAEVYRSLV